jgi:hypothetical protein
MDEIEAKAGRVKLWLDALKGAYLAAMPYSLIVTGVIVLVVFGWWLFRQTDSKNEIKADESRANTTISDVNTAVEAEKRAAAVETVKEAEKRSERAVKNANKARSEPKRDVPFHVANSERCSSYPESEECR